MSVLALSPVILACAVGASAPWPADVGGPVSAAVTPLAAVAPSPPEESGPMVVAVTRAPTALRIAAGPAAPAPPAAVTVPGGLRIPAMALSAYRNAERVMAAANPGCGISWNLLAGIGRIESMHANGGATDAQGTAVRPIYGPVLDGSLPGNEVVVQTRSAERVTYARAMGPMQFLPGTWARYASDGDGDGKSDVQNLFDSTLAAARYLCSGGLDLRQQPEVMTALLRYNNSLPYARNVLGWAAGYATGVVPVALPPIAGPIPALGTAHVPPPGSTNLDQPRGLGPGSPVDATGLPAGDPLAVIPVLATNEARQLPEGTTVPGFAPNQQLGPLPGPLPDPLPGPAPAAAPPLPPWVPPWLAPPPPPPPRCVVFCLEAAPAPPPGPVPLGPAPGPVT